MSAPLVDFVPHPGSPKLEPGSTGIAIAVEARSAHGLLRALHLRGAYRLSIDDARAIDAIPLQKALVVTATSGLYVRTFGLLGETVVFEDDEHSGGGLVTGHFNADLLGRVQIPSYATAYLVASLGPFVSNVASFTVA